jgi:hypothetical protein
MHECSVAYRGFFLQVIPSKSTAILLTEGNGAGSSEKAEHSGGGHDGKGDKPDDEEESTQNQKPPLITKDDIRVFGIALAVSFLIRS